MARTTITVEIPPEVKQKLAEIAKREDRSVSWLVRKAIEAYLDKLPPA